MDGMLIALAILVRAGILWLTAWVADFSQPGWAISAVALIADFGLVAAAAVVTLVDLIILVRDSISQLKTHEAIGN